MAVAAPGNPDQNSIGSAPAIVIAEPAEAEIAQAFPVAHSAPPAPVDAALAVVPPAPPQKPWGPLLLAIYNLLLGGAIAYALTGLLTRWPATLAVQAGAATAAAQAEATVRFLILTSLGAGFGAVIHNLLGLHIHVAVVRDFQPRFSGSYVLGPIAAMGLGFALFVILQGGLMALGGDTAKPEDSLRPALFYIAIGILTGLAWDVIVLKFDTIARQLFGGEGTSRVRHALDRVRGPGEPGCPIGCSASG